MAAMALPKRFNATSYFVDHHCEEGRGEKVAVRYEDEQLTYADVQRMVNQTGNALRADGLRMEERALLMLLDSPAFIAAFFGAIKIGAVPIPINTNLQPADYAYILNDSRARMVIVSAPLLAALYGMGETAENLAERYAISRADQEAFAGHLRCRSDTITLHLSPSVAQMSCSVL
jgi:acyl-coenzyme A synthetase/AMP-(fatty) acid ligase